MEYGKKKTHETVTYGQSLCVMRKQIKWNKKKTPRVHTSTIEMRIKSKIMNSNIL